MDQDDYDQLPMDPSDVAGYVDAPDGLDELLHLVAEWTRAADAWRRQPDMGVKGALIWEGAAARRARAMRRFDAIRERLALANEDALRLTPSLRSTDDDGA